MKINLSKAIEDARHSKWALWKLNFQLSVGIPFNRSHNIRVHSVDDDGITTIIPNIRVNHNHIKGIHACGLATAAEFCSGLVLLRKLDPRKERLIMQRLEIEYFYQAKSSAYARYSLGNSEFQTLVREPLEREGIAYISCEIQVKDQEQNLLCTAKTRWQIKRWDKVKTKV